MRADELVGNVGFVLDDGLVQLAALFLVDSTLVSQEHLAKKLSLGYLIGLLLFGVSVSMVLEKPVVTDHLAGDTLCAFFLSGRKKLSDCHLSLRTS